MDVEERRRKNEEKLCAQYPQSEYLNEMNVNIYEFDLNVPFEWNLLVLFLGFVAHSLLCSHSLASYGLQPAIRDEVTKYKIGMYR